ncbi:MAG TPA: MMPL family transporter [Solirubrobacteraceae bacterium]|nr:MMPL family transporter [Solirubrobacteraceae bacterium]
MTKPLYALGRWTARHHWIVIAAWLAVAVAIAIVSHSAGDETNDNLSMPGTDSTKATTLLESRLPQNAFGSNPLALEVAHGKLTDGANAKAIEATVTNLRHTPHVIRAISPLSKEGAPLLASGKQIAYIPVTLDIGPSDLDKETAQPISDAAAPARDAGIRAAIGGYVGQKLSKPATESSEVVGLAAAVVILMLAFGSAAAMLLPIGTAILGLVIALGLIRLLSHAAEIPTIAPTLATMIGLGVGIDYALFIVTRHKQHLREGMEIEESIARATATSGGAVVFAGVTVVIALISLAAAQIPIVTSLGYSAALAVVTAALGAVTLLPALLGALGPRVNALPVHIGRTHPDDLKPHGWERLARAVSERPWPAMVAAIVVLAVLAIPVLNLHLGQSDVGSLPTDTQARQAFDIISRGFGPGTNGPLLIAARFGTPAKPDPKGIEQLDAKQKQLDASKQKQQASQAQLSGLPPGPQAQAQKQQLDKQAKQLEEQQEQLDAKRTEAENPASDPQFTALREDVAKTPGVKSIGPPTLDKAADAAVFTAIATTAPASRQTEDLVHRLRDTVIPKAVAGTDLHADVGGQTAGYIDLAERISSKLPWMILIVVGLSFLVLMLAFRSLVVPLKAAIMNLLSVGAAYGIVTWVFQEGHLVGVIGLSHSVPIVSFVPLLMFAILFGLSMDYEVFLLTQIHEHYQEEPHPTESVVRGLASTGRVITSAALIMVCVFSSFLLNGDPTVKQFGVGLAGAVAIDATIVRCLLVPTVMVLLGRAAWWLPRWLGRVLPPISIEGEDFFRELDRRSAGAPAGVGAEPAVKSGAP